MHSKSSTAKAKQPSQADLTSLRPEDVLRAIRSLARFYFEFDELAQLLNLAGPAPVLQRALQRLAKRGLVVSVNKRASGWLVIPAEHASSGAPPVSWWIDEVMKPAEPFYYVSLLSAATHWGSVSYDTGTTYVTVSKPRQPLTAGDMRVRFVSKRALAATPTVVVRGPVTHLRVSTREATVLELLQHQSVVRGIEYVARVVRDLAPSMTPAELGRALDAMASTAVAQRLGFLFEALCFDALANQVASWIGPNKTRVASLTGSVTSQDPEFALARRWNVRYDTRLLTVLGIPYEVWR